MKQLAKLRRKKHLSRPVLAEKLGITAEELSEWESGAAVPESQLEPLANILGVAPETVVNALQAQAGRKLAGHGRFFSKKRTAVVSGCLAVLFLAGVVLAVAFVQNQTVVASGNVGESAYLSPKSIMGEPSASQETQPLPEAPSNESASSGEEDEAAFSQSEQQPEQQISSQSGTQPQSQAGSPAQPQGCSHTFITETLMPSCINQGYTEHTCSKCGYYYVDNYTAKRHDYGKYLCEYCGRPDPDNAYYSMSAWVQVNGESDGGEGYLLSSRQEDNLYTISTGKLMSSVVFSCDAPTSGISMIFDKGDGCQLSYRNEHGNGTLSIAKARLSPSMQLSAENFSYTMYEASGEYSEEAFQADFVRAASGMMEQIQTNLLGPRMQLTLMDLGFASFS